MQLLEHPSPIALLESSQSSRISRIPLPQFWAAVRLTGEENNLRSDSNVFVPCKLSNIVRQSLGLLSLYSASVGMCAFSQTTVCVAFNRRFFVHEHVICSLFSIICHSTPERKPGPHIQQVQAEVLYHACIKIQTIVLI